MLIETGFLNRVVTVAGATYRYVVYVPMEWSADREWPIVLFLHGAGERGDDGLAQSEVGLGSAIRKHRDRFPAIVVMPQCRKNTWWQTPEMEALAMATLDAGAAEFRGDPERTYLTGLSMGGYATWDLAGQYPSRFAAIAVVCGGVRPPRIAVREGAPQAIPQDAYEAAAQKVAALPIQVFHGSLDPTVPVSESRQIVEALEALGADVNYTEYKGVGHNSWDRAYNEPRFPAWLFSQKRRPTTP